MFLLLVSLFLNPRPSRELIVRALQEQAHVMLAHTYAASGLFSLEHGRLLCGSLTQLDANLQAGSIACFVWPVGDEPGAVVIPHLCCPAFFPCLPEDGARPGKCVVYQPQGDFL